ncbi:hypothetical protein ACIHFE_06495 [Streptomyces sp. NPDC052396]|uniref:hypothetical protein n=1 Tax=Streptomyces sp. NPDC052396 TaxID=3365689 RepID=UPI0037D608D9
MGASERQGEGMAKEFPVGKSIAGAVLLTLGTVVATLLCLMFSTGGDQVVRREALFGALFFETERKSGGAVGATMGVANPMALIAVFLVFAVPLVAIRFACRELTRRR